MTRMIAAVTLALAGLAAPVAAQIYSCAPWEPKTPAIREIKAIKLSQHMAIIEEGRLKRSVRMSRGSLRRRVFLDEDSVLIAYGDPVLGNGAPPEFGDQVTLQHLRLDEDMPILVHTACERVK